MRIVDPMTGTSYVEKRRVRYNEPGQPREPTSSCYRHYAFLGRDRTRAWFCEALDGEGARGPQSDPAFEKQRARVADARDGTRRTAPEAPLLAAGRRLRPEHHKHLSVACRD